jgi:hypothetical protein
MNNKLNIILKEVTSIQSGLLRFKNKEGQQNLHVKVAADSNCLHCLIADEMPKISGKRIHLIQKYRNDYFFISGTISGEVQHVAKVLSITINKASWFVKRRKGSVTWFSEKHTYQTSQQRMSVA